VVRGFIRLSILAAVLTLFGLSAFTAQRDRAAAMPGFHGAPTYIQYRF